MEPADDRLIGYADVQKRVGYTRQHLSRMEKAAQFPQRIKIGPGRVGWSLAEVTAWIEARKAARTPHPPAGLAA